MTDRLRIPVTFSLEQLADRLSVDRDLLAELHASGGFSAQYDEAEWRIPATDLLSFVRYLLDHGAIGSDGVERLRDRRAGREVPPEIAERRAGDRRQQHLDEAPRRRISDFVSH
jgi:hypothetical protein